MATRGPGFAVFRLSGLRQRGRARVYVLPERGKQRGISTMLRNITSLAIVVCVALLGSVHVASAQIGEPFGSFDITISQDGGIIERFQSHALVRGEFDGMDYVPP